MRSVEGFLFVVCIVAIAMLVAFHHIDMAECLKHSSRTACEAALLH